MQTLLSPSEAAERLRISRSTLTRLTTAGRIRHYRLTPKRVVYREDDLEHYLEACACGGGK